MAEDEINPSDHAGQQELRGEAKRVAAELTVVLEAAAAALETIQQSPEAALLRNQLEIVRELVARAIETVDAFAETMSQSTA